jgi:hypothetical protein
LKKCLHDFVEDCSGIFILTKQKQVFLIILYAIDDVNFVGKKNGKSCPNNLKGAAYATSEVMFTANKMVKSD